MPTGPFEWLQNPTLLGALGLALIAIGALVQMLYSMWKKTAEKLNQVDANKKAVVEQMLDLAKGQRDLAIGQNEKLITVIKDVSMVTQQVNLTMQTLIDTNKDVKESVTTNTQASRELKDFLTGTLVQVLRNNNS